MSKAIKINKEERKILERFFNKVKDTLIKVNHYTPEEADFETYKWILTNKEYQEKQPTEYFNIFRCIPQKNRKAIVKYLGYKTETEFKKKFSKASNEYRQSQRRDENKGEF
jgi:nitrogenase subunit NifH